MSSNEEKINEFLKQMGFSASLGDVLGFPGKAAAVNHMGVHVNVYLFSIGILAIFVSFGYVPKVNVAPFFRRLLALNDQLVGPAFSIVEADNTVRLKNSRLMEGLDFSEFKDMLDGVAQLSWQYGTNLVQEFQLPQQPG